MPSDTFTAGEDHRLASFNQYRGLLFSIAYRMLGSVADAEDILQDAFIRWLQAPVEEIRSTRAFLVTIVSRLCINHLESARVKRDEYFGQWLPEPLITTAGPGTDPMDILSIDESLSMAFLVLLERLTPVERAVFLLREVFDLEYADIGGALGKDEANCRQILRRARLRVAELRPRFEATQQQREKLLWQFRQAATSGNLEALVALLSNDAILYSDGGGRAPAVPNLIHGAAKVARALLGGLGKLVPRNLTIRMAQINGEPGLVSYSDGRSFSVLTLAIADDRISSVYIVTNPEKLAHLTDLPAAPN